MISIQIPSPLRRYTEKNKSVSVAATSVQEALDRLFDLYPEVESHILAEDKKLRSFVTIYVNDEDIRQLEGLATGLKPDSEIMIVPAISGGVIITGQ